jgi:hypothetical protein
MQAPGFREIQLSSSHKKYIQLVTNAELENNFVNILSKGIELVTANSNFNRNLPVVTVFISDTDSFKISYLDNPTQYGSQFNAVVLLYKRMQPLNDMQKLICIVEELVHYFWLIRDEVKTSEIVCSLIPGLTCDSNGQYRLVD